MAQTPPIIDEKAVAKQLKQIAEAIDALKPHLNKANSAFGGLDEQMARLQDLENKVAKARVTYGG